MIMFFVQVFILLIAVISKTLTLTVPQGRLLRKREPQDAANPLLIERRSNFTSQDSIMPSSQSTSTYQQQSPFLKPEETITFGSLGGVAFLLQLDGMQTFGNATLEANLGPLVNDINRYLAKAGQEANVSVSYLLDLWTPTKSQRETSLAIENFSVTSYGAIIPQAFTMNCLKKTVDFLANVILLVMGLIMNTPKAVKKGIKEWVQAFMYSTAFRSITVALKNLMSSPVAGPVLAQKLASLFIAIVSSVGVKDFVRAIFKYLDYWNSIKLIAQTVLTLTAYVASGSTLLYLKLATAIQDAVSVISSLKALVDTNKIEKCF